MYTTQITSIKNIFGGSGMMSEEENYHLYHFQLFPCPSLSYKVQSYEERIVLFVLNYIIFGMLERNLTCDPLFAPHSKEEHAKIFWDRGEAAAFYTVKPKGIPIMSTLP